MALLGGFGDLNVDRSSKDGDKAAAGDKTGGSSTALTIPTGELLKLRVPELKKKLVEAGVDLKKYPGTVEKKVCTRSSRGAARQSLLADRWSME